MAERKAQHEAGSGGLVGSVAAQGKTPEEASAIKVAKRKAASEAAQEQLDRDNKKLAAGVFGALCGARLKLMMDSEAAAEVAAATEAAADHERAGPPALASPTAPRSRTSRAATRAVAPPADPPADPPLAPPDMVVFIDERHVVRPGDGYYALAGSAFGDARAGGFLALLRWETVMLLSAISPLSREKWLAHKTKIVLISHPIGSSSQCRGASRAAQASPAHDS